MTSLTSPDVVFGQLFIDVQLGHVFPDAKTFVDCTPKANPAEILHQYESRRHKPGFDLNSFIYEFFDVPEPVASDFVSDTSLSTAEHINRLWDLLSREADTPADFSSRVPLPYPYVVPGGRFREIFYWDSYFTMLGLREAGRVDLIRGMIDNFAYLINTLGFIPNGNRTYFLTRSQPPFFALMVQLLADMEGLDVLTKYLPQLQREWEFWMDGQDQLTADNTVVKRVVLSPDGSGTLNRYWDPTPTPRAEAYRVEYELNQEAKHMGVDLEALHKHLRAACESGWDFSSRWLTDGLSIHTIRTADVIPVDLNCLLYYLEATLSDAYALANDYARAAFYEQAAADRAALIERFFWSNQTTFYHDINHTTGEQIPNLTLAGVFPLFINIATPEQAVHIHDILKVEFLQAGGWVTTLAASSQQWDWPNGWAPLQWIVYIGLTNYGFDATANEGRDHWLALNDKVFEATGKMTEKYNVVDAALTTGGGKYPNQDGFGWTNGVYLALSAEHDRNKSHN